MTEQSPKRFGVHSILLAVLALIYAGWAAIFIARTSIETSSGRYFCLFDDAMVSLRYAWNLAHGDGLVWNPGERVEGTTCFLFTLYMSLGALFLGKSAAALFVQLTGVVFVVGTALLVDRLNRDLSAAPLLGVVTAALVLAYYPLSYWSLMGMETGMLTVLSMAALFVAMRLGPDSRSSKLLGLLLGLMFATRPDAAVPAAVVLAFRGAWILRRHRRVAALEPWLLEVALFAGIVAALTLFRVVYYGSPLPNTYDLKVGDWSLFPRLLNGWKFVEPFLDTSRYLLLLALLAVAFGRDGRRLLLLCFAGSIVACQIWVGGDAWRPYWRMLVPGVVALMVLAVDGSHALARWILRRDRHPLALGLSLVCAAGALLVANQPFVAEQRLQAPAFYVELNQDTVKAGIELSRLADKQGSVAVMAAGAVPYYSGLRGVDVLGKSDRTIARMHKDPGYKTVVPGHNKYDLRYSIVKLKPDVIYGALQWVRYQPDVFEFVRERYVQGGSFWFRRDSPYVHWNRIPPS